MAGRTGGDWKAGRADMISYDANGCMYKNVYADDPRGGRHPVTNEKIPYVVGKMFGDTPGECIANAQLCALAPTMAGILEDIIHYNGGADSPLHDEYLLGRIIQALDVIRMTKD